MPTRAAILAAALAGLSVGVAGGQDPKPAGSAVQLPDGTVVLFTKNSPDDPAPKIDGVLLPPKEYERLRAEADAARKAKEAARPVPPTACHVRARIDPRRDRPVAALKVTYQFRTTLPRQTVLLGGPRAFPVGATADDGKLPVLDHSPDGWTVVTDAPGEHTLTLDLEAAVTPRGAKGEHGFDLGLPRAAITTLAVEPAGPEVKRLTVATRTPDAAGPPRVSRATDDVARYAPKGGTGHGPPLGPAESVEVVWDAPAAAPPAPADAAASADAEVSVQVDEGQVETAARVRLKGGPREWRFALPPTAEATVGRADPAREADPAEPPAAVTRPTEPNGLWVVRVPDAGEWVLAVTARQLRPDPKDAKYPGPYPVGPVQAVGPARQSGAVRVTAPVGVRVRDVRHPPEVRPQEVPPGDDPPAAVFRYAALPPAADGHRPGPLVEFRAERADGVVVAQPAHTLKLGPAGWRLRTEVRVSPVRRLVDHVAVELPAGWQPPLVQPFELVDEVQGGKDPAAARVLTVRLAGGRRDPFTLVIETTFPLPADAGEASVPLPRFPGAAEREARLTVEVPEGYEVRGTAREADGTPTELKPAAGAIGRLAGAFDAGVGRADLAWKPHRPDLAAEVRAEVSLSDRGQAVVSEHVTLRAADPIRRPVRLRGPAAAVAFVTRPPADPAGPPGEWTVTPPANTKELTVSISYAVTLPPRAAGGGPVRAPIPLVWPDATRVEAGVRVWAADAGGRPPVRVVGPWRERPPEPDRERDALPWATLDGTGGGLPLAVELADAGEADGPVVERAAIQASVAEDGAVQVRGRFLLRRWSAAGVEVETPAAGPPAVRVDKARVTPEPTADGRVVRVPVPAGGAARPTAVLEVQYTLPPAAGGLTLDPPRLRGASYRSAVWWHAAVPGGAVPLLPAGPPAEVRWRWRDGFAPLPAVSADDLDHWFAAGADADDAPDPAGGEAVAFRQPAPAAVRLARVPRPAWVFGCSGAAMAVLLGLARLRPAPLGAAVAALGVLAAMAAAGWPQPAGQAAAAAQYGAAAAGLAVAAQGYLRWRHRRRLARLVGFSRGPVAAAPADSVRPSKAGANGVPAADGKSASAPPLAPSAAS